MTSASPAEVATQGPIGRVACDVRAALRRKPVQEARLAGALRALASVSQEARDLAAEAVDVLVRRGSFDRALYGAAVRGLAEACDRRVVDPLRLALAEEDAGGLASFSAASLMDDGDLSEVLARAAASRHAHVSFAAEVARVARGEADGRHVASIAPMIKESHRIALCVELLVPLLRRRSLPLAIAPALGVLRDAERHLGRWLVLAELAARAGDAGPLREATEHASSGPGSSRAAWSMVVWALGGVPGSAPPVRPTVELVARLSDRPSANRDTTFLFRLAAARVAGARGMLEGQVKGRRLVAPGAVRAALYLARDHGRADLGEALRELGGNPRKEPLRGIAAAALHDLGDVSGAQQLATQLTHSRHLTTATWSVLVRAANGAGAPVLTEATFRRVQLGWVE